MSIKDVRESAGITQTRLALISGVAREQINKYERGKIKPDLKTLLMIRDALGCTLDELVAEKGKDSA